jgi:hypothetical protein
LSLAAAATFLVLLALLHIIKPELDPSWRMISEYEIGEFGWVMRLAFLALSFSHAALLVAIRPHVRTIGGRVGLVLLLLGVVGTAMGGIFTTDPITATEDQLTTRGSLHGMGFLLGVPAFPIAATLISRALALAPAWAWARRPLLWAATLPWVGIVGFAVWMAVMLPRGHGKLTPEVLIGWPNRLLIVANVAWLITVAWQAFKVHHSGPMSIGPLATEEEVT